MQAGAWKSREKMAVPQCIKYEESLPGLLLSPCVPVPGRGQGGTLWGDSKARRARIWACCKQGKQQGEAAFPRFLLQAWCACEALAPLGPSSHTHLITITGLGNKVVFNSESIRQPGRAGSAGSQPQSLPCAAPVQ